MSTLNPTQFGPTRFEPKARKRLAASLLCAPTVMLVASAFSAISERTGDDATTAHLSTLFDLLTPPALIAMAIAMFLVLSPWGGKTALTASTAMVLQACGLSAVVGIEMVSNELVKAGIPESATEDAMDNLPGSIPGAVLAVMFFLMLLVGLIASGIATWRARWVPRLTPLVLFIFPVLDIGLPEQPKYLHTLAFAVLLTAFTVLARAVVRTGAPGPVSSEHTPAIGQTVST